VGLSITTECAKDKVGIGVLLDLPTGVKVEPGLCVSCSSFSVLSYFTVSSYGCIYRGVPFCIYDLRLTTMACINEEKVSA
jgi:hypothetical protein